MEDNYLGINDVSKKLKIAKSTLYAYTGKSKIPFIKIGGKLLFPENDLNAWLNSMKHNPLIPEENQK